MSKEKSSSISIWDEFSEKIESLREALNTPADENDSSVKPIEDSEDSEVIYQFTEKNTVSLSSFDIESLRKALNTPIDEIIASEKSTEEAAPDIQDEDIQEFGPSDNGNGAVDIEEQPDISEIHAQTVDETDTIDETYLEEITGPDIPEINAQLIEKTDTIEETYREEIIDVDTLISNTDGPDYPDDKHEDQVEEEINIDVEAEPEDLIPANDQTPKADESHKVDNKQDTHDVEIKIKTEKSIKSEKIDNYWKQGEKPNPYILKVDKSREELNRSLEIAREMVNRQSEEPLKQEKKRFQLRFTRGEKNEDHKSNSGKEKHSKNTTEFKPMVYEILEPKQDIQPKQDILDTQHTAGKQERRVKETPRKVDDRAKNDQEKEIINHRNRLEKSRSLGVPVFVKKPVNLDQIRQLKSMLISQNNVKILVDTGSSQGRLLVISGQDPDTLLNTLGQLPIVKSTAVEDETINITL